MHGYNKRNGTMGSVPVSRSVYQTGPGAWEIKAKCSSGNFTNGDVHDKEQDIFPLGSILKESKDSHR